ncbi:MAG: SusC/RagA family TonB-linked outer membrane protein [Ferruginibacter sp.]
MRRFLSLFTMLMLCGVLAFAQSRVVSGRVTDKSGKPVPFASVLIKGKATGVQTDVNGDFTIKASTGDVLVISSQSFNAEEVTVGTGSTVAAVLSQKANTIQEVIVTSAFSTKRTLRSQSSNVQNVNGDQLNTIRQSNINNALAGKVAGMQVQSQSYGKLGAETRVRLRGENGIAGAGPGALYVVDGTIIPSANDINPDDIEDVTVLQGPAASALFGPDGAQGAIVINTKKAKRGSRGSGLGIEINSGIQYDKVYILPDYQNTYAGGVGQGSPGADMARFDYIPGYHPAGWAALDGKYYPDYQEDESWGPRMVGQEYIPWYAWYPGTERSFKTAKLTAQPNNVRNYFNTGITKTNNINFTKGGEGYNLRISYTNLDQKGIIPTSYLKRHTLNASFSADLSSKWTVAANINYINQKSNAENDDTYSNNTSGSFNQWFHRDLDIDIMREFKDYKTAQGILATWNHGNPGLYDPNNPARFYRSYYWFSPFAWQENISNYLNRDRIFGDASLAYKVNSDLTLKFTYRKQQLTTNSEVRQYKALETSVAGNTLAGFNYWETVANRAATWQGFGFGNSYSNRQNYELLASYRKKIRDFQLNANAGFDILKTTGETFNWNSTGGLLVADEFLMRNSKTTPVETRTLSNSKRRALFIRADIGYKNFLFVEGTYRRDYTSTEAPGNYIDTKSVGGSFVFSDLINKNNKNSILSYGKLRVSYGQILSALGIYDNNSGYGNQYPTQWNGNIRLVTEPDVLIDPALHGVYNTEVEYGLDLRFLKNRIGFSATYWDRTNKDFPFDASIYPGTGYTTARINAGTITKRGIDLQLTLNPIKTKNVDWNLTATWGRLIDNTVESIYQDIQRTATFANGQAGLAAYVVNEKGMKWGQLVGYGIMKQNGVPVVDPSTGFFVRDTALAHFGSILPDYTGGFQNSFNLFKNFVININIDYSFGGKYFSLSKYYGYGTGLYQATAGLNDRGIPMRDDVANGGGVHVVGVDEQGKPVDMYVKARDYFQQFSYGDNIAEPYIEDLTFVKLRELSLGYRIPVEKLGIGKYFNSATFSIVARNPWLIYSKSTGFDPSEISTNYGEDGQLPGTRSLGVNLKIGF